MGTLAVVVSALKPTSLKGVCTKEHAGNDCLGSDQDRAGLESGQLPPCVYTVLGNSSLHLSEDQHWNKSGWSRAPCGLWVHRDDGARQPEPQAGFNLPFPCCMHFPRTVLVSDSLWVSTTGFQTSRGVRKWQPTPVFLPGDSQRRGSLVGCCPWGHTESDMTEVTWQQRQQGVIFLVLEPRAGVPKMWLKSLVPQGGTLIL